MQKKGFIKIGLVQRRAGAHVNDRSVSILLWFFTDILFHPRDKSERLLEWTTFLHQTSTPSSRLCRLYQMVHGFRSICTRSSRYTERTSWPCMSSVIGTVSKWPHTMVIESWLIRWKGEN